MNLKMMMSSNLLLFFLLSSLLTIVQVDFNYQAGQFKGNDYTVMLLSNEDNSKALFLYVQANNFVTGIQTDILIADFMKDGDACA